MAALTPSLVPTKRCSCCDARHPLSAFGRNCQTKDGLHYYCKACAAKKQKQWARANPATVKRMRGDYLTRMKAQNAQRDPYE